MKEVVALLFQSGGKIKKKSNILAFLDLAEQPCVLDTRKFSGRVNQPRGEREPPQGCRRPILSY